MNQAQLASWVRGLLKTGAGALAAHGVTQNSVTAQLTQLAGAAIAFLIAQIWSHFVLTDTNVQKMADKTAAAGATTPAQPTVGGNLGGTLKLLLVLVVPAIIFLTPACNTTLAPGGAYSTVDTNTGQALGPFVFGVDKILVDSKDTLYTFCNWELQNRGSLTGSLHSVTVAADQIRLQAPLWFTNAYNLRSNYLWIRVNAPLLAPGASNNLQSAATQLSSQAATAQALQTSH